MSDPRQPKFQTCAGCGEPFSDPAQGAVFTSSGTYHRRCSYEKRRESDLSLRFVSAGCADCTQTKGIDGSVLTEYCEHCRSISNLPESPLQTCDCQAHGGIPHPDSPDESNNAPNLMARIDELEAERDGLRAALRVARDFVIAIDHASVNRFEPRRVEMVQSIDTILGETPK